MAKQTINTGTGEFAGDGESIRSAFTKANENFTELYTVTTATNNWNTAYGWGDHSIAGYLTTVTNVDLTAVSQNIVPSANATYDLGSTATQWKNLYIAGNVTLGNTNTNIITINGKTTIEGLTVGTGGGNGTTNVAIGLDALAANEVGPENTAIGAGALSTNYNGASNTAIGFESLKNSYNGQGNVGVGFWSLRDLSGSYHNIAIGFEAMKELVSGYENIGIGPGALNDATITGGNNIAIGNQAGIAIGSGDYNVIIGGDYGSSIANLSNRIIISDGAGNIRITVDNNGVVAIPATVSSTSTTTGALIVKGGVGIGGSLFVGGTIYGRLNIQGTPPSTSKGNIGDTSGMISVTSASIFYCISDFTPLPNSATVNVSGGDGVNSGIALALSVIPSVGWTISYNSQSSTINQVVQQGSWYVVFWNDVINVPTGATITYGPDPLANIWVKQNWGTTGNW